MYPGTWAQQTPEKPALIMSGSGRTLTYAELDDRSLRLARTMMVDTGSFPTIGSVTKAARELRDWQPDFAG